MAKEEWFKSLRPGQIVELGGNVTTLNWLMPGAERRTEENVGYRTGRLDGGYVIALLIQHLTKEQFTFQGTTLRSGGKMGLPAATQKQDAKRPGVYQGMLNEYGTERVAEMKEDALKTTKIVGAKRIAKVLPFTPVPDDYSPAAEYPMGGGGLQWDINNDRKAKFVIALQVDDQGMARTSDFEVSLKGPHMVTLDARTKIRQFLEAASA